jgi:hypothetical protein
MADMDAILDADLDKDLEISMNRGRMPSLNLARAATNEHVSALRSTKYSPVWEVVRN